MQYEHIDETSFGAGLPGKAGVVFSGTLTFNGMFPLAQACVTVKSSLRIGEEEHGAPRVSFTGCHNEDLQQQGKSVGRNAQGADWRMTDASGCGMRASSTTAWEFSCC